MDGLPSLFSSLKSTLWSVEKAIPPVDNLAREIGKNVTNERRTVASLFTTVLDRWLVSLPNAEDLKPSSAGVEDEAEEHYRCDDDIRDSLKEFHDSIQRLWPDSCEVPHKLMLKLAPRRQYEREGRQKVLALDTLSSCHEQHWGRIVFTLRHVPGHCEVPVCTELAPLPARGSGRRVAFAGETLDDSDDSLDEVDDYTAQAPRKVEGASHKTKPDREELCSLIERSGERVCLRVDIKSLKSSEPRGEKGIRTSKPTVALRDILTPLKMAGCDHEKSRQLLLTPGQKAELGLVLACSLLQLCRGGWGQGARESAWLRRDWTTDGICFLPGFGNKLNTGSPYLPLRLDSCSEEGEFDYYASSVVALATTLVQLQDDEVIQELDSIFQELVEDGQMTPTTKYCALLELLEMDVFTSYVDERCQAAIKACLTGEFANSIGLEDEAFTKNLFHTMVVRPLAEYHHLMQQSATRNGFAQKLSETAGQWDNAHKSGLPTQDVKAVRVPSQEPVHSVRVEADNATLGDIFPIQDAAFQTGWHARPADWLNDLKKVSGAIALIQRKGVSPPRPVRVAILDTGVDLSRPFFQEGVRRANIKGLADFLPDSKSAETATDTFGHGSLMAQLLMEVAPMAEVYIARVAKDTNSLARSSQQIVQAVQWADQQDVDIISMSFGFAEYDLSIAKAIEAVHARRGGSVIFVASAGNSLYEPEKFPARHPFVIPIYATDRYGTFAKSNPSLRSEAGLVFGTYGDQLPSRFVDDYGKICQPGSSVATAIAAAIAANMLTYIESLPLVKLAVLDDEVEMEQEMERRRERLLSLQKLRTKDGMSGLFNRMAPDKTHPRQRWICPIWFWHDRRDDVERETALLEVASDVRTVVPVRN